MPDHLILFIQQFSLEREVIFACIVCFILSLVPSWNGKSISCHAVVTCQKLSRENMHREREREVHGGS